MTPRALMTQAVWMIQVVVAALLLLIGGLDLLLDGPASFAGAALRIVGVVQILSAIGMVALCAVWLFRRHDQPQHVRDHERVEALPAISGLALARSPAGWG